MNTFLSSSIRELLPEHEILIYIPRLINIVAHKRPFDFYHPEFPEACGNHHCFKPHELPGEKSY